MGERSPRFACWLALFLAGSVAATGQAQAPDRESPSGARVTAQVAVGVLLTPIGFFGTGLAVERLAERAGWTEQKASRAAYVAAYTGTLVAAAAGPTLVGSDGRFGAALAGSAVGLVASTLAVRLGNLLFDRDRRECGVICWTLGAVTIALPSFGATVAYNASRP